MWEASVEGRPLRFRLAGINNQNFIMRDEETGSWWQQVSGEAILGPLAGKRLRLVPHDEISFAVWKRESPHGRVLRPDERIAAAGQYAPADWEARVGRMPVVTPDLDARLEPRALVVGVEINGESRAYPMASLQSARMVADSLGGVPIALVVGEDGRSVRAFERRVEGRALDLYLKPEAGPPVLLDAQTGSAWDFTGRSTGGALAGRQLPKVTILKDYWFDWKSYHPQTTVWQ